MPDDHPTRPFLTAEWRFLVMLNYAVDPAVLSGLIPAGTELDRFGGKTYVTLVGFRFERTRLRGLWVPFHSDFDEVNLRFYVKRMVDGQVRRGVVFVREIVPLWTLAKVAQICFREKYVAMPMGHRVVEPTSEGGRVQAEYRWRHQGTWNSVRAECAGRPAYPPSDSGDFFFIEHYWGYSAQPDGSTLEYRVDHDRWRVWPATNGWFEGDAAGLYGRDMAEYLIRKPDSALVVEGSSVAVYRGRRI